MLVLSRNVQEKIMIGNDIVVTLLSVKGQMAKLGFEAPKDVKVDREEIFKKCRAEETEKSHNK